MSSSNQDADWEPNLSPAKKQRRSPAKRKAQPADQSQATSALRQDGRAQQAEEAGPSTRPQTQDQKPQMPLIPAPPRRSPQAQPMLPQIPTAARSSRPQPRLPEAFTRPAELPRINSQTEGPGSLRAPSQLQAPMQNPPSAPTSSQRRPAAAAGPHSGAALPIRGVHASAIAEPAAGAAEQARIAKSAYSMAKYFNSAILSQMKRENSMRTGLESLGPSGQAPANQPARAPIQGGQPTQHLQLSGREVSLQARSAQGAPERSPVLRQASHSLSTSAAPSPFAHPGPTTSSEGPSIFVSNHEMNSFLSPQTGMPVSHTNILPLAGPATLVSEPGRAAASRLPDFEGQANTQARAANQLGTGQAASIQTAQASPHLLPIARLDVTGESEGRTSEAGSSGPGIGAGPSPRPQSHPASGVGATIGAQRRFPAFLEAPAHTQCLHPQNVDHLKLTLSVLQQTVRNLIPIMQSCEMEIVRAVYLDALSRIRTLKSILEHEELQGLVENSLNAKAECMAQWQVTVRRDPSFSTSLAGRELLASYERHIGNAIYLQRKQHAMRHADLMRPSAENQELLIRCKVEIAQEQALNPGSPPTVRLRELEAKLLILQGEMVYYRDKLHALNLAGRQREQELTDFVRSAPPETRRS